MKQSKINSYQLVSQIVNEFVFPEKKLIRLSIKYIDKKIKHNQEKLDRANDEANHLAARDINGNKLKQKLTQIQRIKDKIQSLIQKKSRRQSEQI